MGRNLEIIPAILATTEEDYSHKLQAIQRNNLFNDNWVQIDFVDNRFVQNQTIGMDVIARHPTDLKREAHLMVEDPEEWIGGLARLGFGRAIVHFEVGRTGELIEKIKGQGMEVGVAINIETEVAKIEPFAATIDLVLVMSIHPGFGGQELIPEAVERVREVSRLRSENSRLLIGVDGGINEFNAEGLVAAGADALVIGVSRLINNGQDTQTFTKLKQLLSP